MENTTVIEHEDAPEPGTSLQVAEATMPAQIPQGVVTQELQSQLVGATGGFSGVAQYHSISALQMLRDMKPQDAAETMIITQAIAAQAASLQAYERASLPNLPLDLQAQQLNLASKLGRAAVDALEAIDRKRRGPKQTMNVERVIVEDGGQAIVGQVAQKKDASQ